MKKLKLKAYAKINLYLDVVSRASNGYHGVKTVMQTVSLCDDVTVALRDAAGLSIESDIPFLPRDSRNLAWRAAELFFENTGILKGADIILEKRIPMAAGLAGGSADAAAVLWALNELCSRPLDVDSLCALGAKLGADVPFCIVGGTKYADGFGEKLHPFVPMPKCHIVIACAGEGVSTPEAYSALDFKYDNFKLGAHEEHSIAPLKDSMISGKIEGMANAIYNIFEPVISEKRPLVKQIKNTLRSQGAINAMMSGSGPSVFGIFSDSEQANAAANLLRTNNIFALACEPIDTQIDRF